MLKPPALLNLLVFAALLPFADASAASDALYRYAPVASWVVPATTDYDAPEPAGEVSSGTWVLALDRQVDVTASGDDTYQYSATKVLNDTGVEERSQIDLEVDPTYQTFDIHFLRLRRGGTTIDASPTARITALPQETQLRARIYNGTYNINILLADVRAGDVVEYAYTLHSREKLFPGHFATWMTVGWSVPVHWHRVRVRAPLDRLIRAKLSDGSATPELKVRGGVRELELEWRDLAGIQGEDHRPSWYVPWPMLYLSDFKDWGEVARSVDSLFAPALRATEPVAAAARQIAAAGGTPEQLALRALQYVQEQVSYVSISIGAGGYRPTQPDAVLQRRYGDCKDKSVLLVSLLAQLHIGAQPALVNTRRGRILGDMLPTPFAFDHAIVRMQLGDRPYWLDGTDVKQYAPLGAGAQPDYENALLVDTTTDRLVPMPRPSPDSRRRDVTVTIDLSAGFDKPGKLTVLTRYQNATADEMRSSLTRKSLEKRRAEYLDYQTRYYPSAKSAGPLQIEDDKTRDVIEVRENYTLASALVDEKNRRVLNLHADELYDYGETISSTERRAPLALEYPIRLSQHVIVLMPEVWAVRSPGIEHVDNPAFRYRSEVRSSGRKVELKYEYQALADQVAPAALNQYLADRKKFYDDLGYVMRRDKPRTVATARRSPSVIEQMLMAVFLFSVTFSSWACRSLSRWNPAPQTPRANAPEGIGGWLLLPATGVALAPIVTILAIIVSAFSTHLEDWREALLPAALIVACSVLFSIQSRLISLFFARRTSAPGVFIAAAWLTVACAAGMSAWMATVHMPSGVSASVTQVSVFIAVITLIGAAPALAFAVIGTLYMQGSERARATFQRQYSPYSGFVTPAL